MNLEEQTPPKSRLANYLVIAMFAALLATYGYAEYTGNRIAAFFEKDKPERSTDDNAYGSQHK